MGHKKIHMLVGGVEGPYVYPHRTLRNHFSINCFIPFQIEHVSRSKSQANLVIMTILMMAITKNKNAEKCKIGISVTQICIITDKIALNECFCG